MTNEQDQPFYESNRAVSEYLLFHYGTTEEQVPHDFGPHSALNYPVRCVTECLVPEILQSKARALDLGCAVGRSTFELARHCEEAIGIDFSHAFIDRANQLKAEGRCDYAFATQGKLTQQASAKIDGQKIPGGPIFAHNEPHFFDGNVPRKKIPRLFQESKSFCPSNTAPVPVLEN